MILFVTYKMEKVARLEKNRAAKKAREEWLSIATGDELLQSLSMKRVGYPGCDYIIHPTYGRINRSHIIHRLQSMEMCPVNEIRAPLERNEEYYEKHLYALHISNRKSRLEILHKNHEVLMAKYDLDKSDEILLYKLNRILEEIKKIEEKDN